MAPHIIGYLLNLSWLSNFMRLGKNTTIIVTLSVEFLSNEALSWFSAALAISYSISFACNCLPYCISLLRVDMKTFPTSLFDNASKIPSDPIDINPCRTSSILNCLISGTATTTPNFPPYFGSFASISPKVLETANHPGFTLGGPMMILGSILDSIFAL